jgi:hypothetical protein
MDGESGCSRSAAERGCGEGGRGGEEGLEVEDEEEIDIGEGGPK